MLLPPPPAACSARMRARELRCTACSDAAGMRFVVRAVRQLGSSWLPQPASQPASKRVARHRGVLAVCLRARVHASSIGTACGEAGAV